MIRSLISKIVVIENKKFPYKRTDINKIVSKFDGFAYHSVYNDCNTWRVQYQNHDMALRSIQQLKKYGYTIISMNIS